MNSTTALLRVTLGFVIASGVSAQCFNPNIGIALGAGDNTISANVALGFTFTWPDGTTSTAIDIDSNGRILQPGTGVSANYVDPYAFVSGATTVVPFWSDIDPSDPLSDDVYFFTDSATTAVITWQDVVTVGGTQPFSVQATLRSDGSMTFTYDGRAGAIAGYDLPLVGVAPGGGANYVAQTVDWSTTVGTLFDSAADPLVFEDFFYTTSNFDIGGQSFDLTPNGTGGYLVTGMDCGFATAQQTGESCFPPAVALDWIADGTGGYIVAPSAGGFDGRLGASLGLGDDDVANQALGFSFTMPGGNVVTSIDVDSNGRVLEGGLGASLFAPDVPGLLTDPSASICPCWADINPAGGGDVTFFSDNAGFASVTWSGVPQFGLNNRISFQIQLRAPDSWSIVFTDLSDFDLGVSDFVVGCSQGGAATDPGESDLTATPVLSSGNATLYELFTAGEAVDLSVDTLQLTVQAPPAIGGSFDLSLVRIPATTVQAAVFLGTANPGLNLGLVFPGLPCSLLSNNNLGTINLSASGWAPGMPTANLSISLAGAGPGVVGLPLVVQGVIVDPTVPWAASLPIATTNAVEAVVGN